MFGSTTKFKQLLREGGVDSRWLLIVSQTTGAEE